MSNPVKQTIKMAIEKVASLIAAIMNQGAKNSPQDKINQRMLFNFYQYAVSQGYRFDLADTGFRNYSQFEEDGILLYIFAVRQSWGGRRRLVFGNWWRKWSGKTSRALKEKRGSGLNSCH